MMPLKWIDKGNSMRVLNFEKHMRVALEEAMLALNEGEVPIGAVVVYENRIVSRAHNLIEKSSNRMAHAEIIAMERAFDVMPDKKRLTGCTLYSTLEPCAMCAGAVVNCGVDRVVFGAYDTQFGCCGSLTDIPRMLSGDRVWIMGGILQYECEQLIKRFFNEVRKQDALSDHSVKKTP